MHCCCSVAKSFLTFCDPMDCSMPGFPVCHSLLEFAQIHAHWVSMLSKYLLVCRPQLLFPLIFPSIRVFSSESALCIRWPKYWSFRFSLILPMHIQGWFLLGLIPACNSSSLAFRMMYSAHKLNKQDDNIHLYHISFPILNGSVVSCKVLTVASWSTYKFLWGQVRLSNFPTSLGMFHSLSWPTHEKMHYFVLSLAQRKCLIKSGSLNELPLILFKYSYRHELVHHVLKLALVFHVYYLLLLLHYYYYENIE